MKLLTNNSLTALIRIVKTALKGKADSVHNHDNRYYTETEVNNLLKNKSDISHIHDRGTNSIEEKSTTGIRFSKIGEITCANKYQRINQQFIFNTRDESALVTIEFQSNNNTLFSGQSISYMPLTSSVNFINNLRAGFNLVGTNANRFEMWYRQDQWGASLNIVPIGVNRENYHITWYNVNATAANSATEPSFSTKINFTRLLDWSFITGKPTSLPANGGTAAALSTNAGGDIQPVYFTGGKPTACTYTLGKSVPSNAVFTDTVYTHPSSHSASMITQDTTHRFVTDTQVKKWDSSVSKVIRNITVTPTANSDATTNNFYPFKATVTINGVTANDIADASLGMGVTCDEFEGTNTVTNGVELLFNANPNKAVQFSYISVMKGEMI